MRIKYITEDDLNAVYGNIEDITKKLVLGKEQTLETLLKKENLIKDSQFEINEFELDMSQPKGKESLTDLENIKRVYNHMKGLSDSQASDERIWAAYTFGECLDYMKYRYCKVTTAKEVVQKYLYGYSPQRSLFRNGMARLWWIGRVTYDEKRQDPYELTKFICKDQDYIESICGRNVFNNPEIGLTVLKVLDDSEKKGKKINRRNVRDLAKYVNLLAGMYIIDTFDSEIFYNKIEEKLNEILQNGDKK